MFDGITEKFKQANHKLSSGKIEYPSKTTINFAVDTDQAEATPPVATAIGVVIVLIVAVFFAKFCVVDLLNESSAASAKASTMQAQLSQLQASNADYADIKKQLDSYSALGMTEDESAYANREHALAVASMVSSLSSQLDSVSLNGNTMQIQMVNTSLATVSATVTKISKSKWVQSVLPNTAQNDDNSKNITATITVELVPSAAASAADASSSNSAQGGN